ncbi:MAG: selenide, water dikinase SelD [Terriglobales bacterium]
MPRLTELARACGCAAKLSPQLLDEVLPGLRIPHDPNLVVGFEGAEDAAVYRLAVPPGGEIALVQTVDFFTPIVDDPADFGAIAAANALSDIYAMGGTPMLALSVLAYPPDAGAATLRKILQGGLEILAQAGCSLGGGHSVRDEELKFGFSITGTVPLQHLLRNSGAQAGDHLFLTKPIGVGLLTTALKRGLVGNDHGPGVSVEDFAAAVASMRALNRDAAAAAVTAGAHGATDVTGFGLLGHAREMALASQVHLRIQAAAVPLLAGARARANDCQSQGLHNNRSFVAPAVTFASSVPEDLRVLLFDPQTSGGLLVSLPASAASGFPGVCIGSVEPARSGAPCLSVD